MKCFKFKSNKNVTYLQMEKFIILKGSTKERIRTDLSLYKTKHKIY